MLPYNSDKNSLGHGLCVHILNKLPNCWKRTNHLYHGIDTSQGGCDMICNTFSKNQVQISPEMKYMSN